MTGVETEAAETMVDVPSIDGSLAWRRRTVGGALAGLRVLDLSRVLAGPFAAQMMADHGASVVKVEAPDGDETRTWGPPFDEEGLSAYFAGLNHGKANVCLDLRTEEGRELLGHLIDGADVVIENFKAGTMARWGFDYESVLAGRRPELVYCRITGYGVDGPMGGLPGYDAALQSFGGLMSVNGYPDRQPLRVGVPIVDILAANLAFSGILLALRERDRSGHGQLVDIALLDAVMSMLHPHSANHLVSGDTPGRTGDFHPTVVPYQVFATATGDLFVSAANDPQFRRLLEVLGLVELADDPRFAANSGRSLHREELIAILSDRIAPWDRDELARELSAVGVPCSAVHTVSEALASDQVRHRDLVVLDEDGRRRIGSPLHLSRSSVDPTGGVEARGQSSEDVLRAIGYDDAAIARLRDSGAIG